VWRCWREIVVIGGDLVVSVNVRESCTDGCGDNDEYFGRDKEKASSCDNKKRENREALGCFFATVLNVLREGGMCAGGLSKV
jgi:hypothetical protein